MVPKMPTVGAEAHPNHPDGLHKRLACVTCYFTDVWRTVTLLCWGSPTCETFANHLDTIKNQRNDFKNITKLIKKELDRF